MYRTVITLLILLTFGCFQPKSVFGQDIQTPWAWGIVSDFGPRIYNGWDFHAGIDYSAAACDDDLGTPIPAVEGGTISAITASGAYAIHIGQWSYFHIFRSGVYKVGNWELTQGAILVNPSNQLYKVQGNVIILWSGSQAVKKGGKGSGLNI